MKILIILAILVCVTSATRGKNTLPPYVGIVAGGGSGAESKAYGNYRNPFSQLSFSKESYCGDAGMFCQYSIYNAAYGNPSYVAQRDCAFQRNCPRVYADNY